MPPRSIGHDEWEREVLQDLDERGRVRVVTHNVTVAFPAPPTPDQIAQILAAHAPTEVWEVRQEELRLALATRMSEVDALVAARAPPGTHPRVVAAERENAERQVRGAVEEDLREARRAARVEREGRGELRPLRPVTIEELRARAAERGR